MDLEYTELLNHISRADKAHIDAIFNTAYNRFRELNPDWEIIYLSYPKETSTAGRRNLDTLIEFLRNVK